MPDRNEPPKAEPDPEPPPDEDFHGSGIAETFREIEQDPSEDQDD